MSDNLQFAEWRKLLKVTQGELGHLLGVCERSVRRMEKGTVPIQKSHFVHLKMLFKQCWFPSSLHTLEAVLGKRVYMGREWRHISDPRQHYLLIKSAKEQKRFGIVIFNTLADPLEYPKEHDVTYSSVEEAGGIYSKHTLLFEDKWPEGWKRHPAR